MAAPPRSQRLIAWVSTTAGYSPAFTCPAGMVTLVKAGAFQNSTGASITVSIVLANAANNVVVTIYSAALAANTSVQETSWHVLNPGDRVQMYASASGINAWLSGAVLN